MSLPRGFTLQKTHCEIRAEGFTFFIRWNQNTHSKGRRIMMHPSHIQKFLSEFYAVETTNSLHNDLVLYGRFKLQTSFIGSRISFTCMHFYETCPSLRCTHDIQNITHTVGQVQIKSLSWNPVQIPHRFLKPKSKFVHNLYVHFVMVFIPQSWSMTHQIDLSICKNWSLQMPFISILSCCALPKAVLYDM